METKIRVKKPREYFSAQTARWAKLLGDSILIVGTTLSALSIESMPHYVTYLSIGFTLIGKLLTNFFSQ